MSKPNLGMLSAPALARTAAPSALHLQPDQVPELDFSGSPPAELAALVEPQSLAAEQFRRLAIGLQHLRARRELRHLLVTSAAPGEGKSISAANLAITLARPGGQRVLLIEGDLHRPSLARRLKFNQPFGLADWIEGHRELQSCLGRWPEIPLWILPAARPTRLPLELLQAMPPARILPLLASHWDWIIVDSPPLLAMADASHWSRACDGVIMVVRRGRTRLSDLCPAAAQIETDKWLGVLFNENSVPGHDYYRQYYA